MSAAVGMDRPDRVDVFVQQHQIFRRLDDLKRKGHVGEPRHARQVALRFRIGGRPVLEVLLLLRGRPGLIGDLVAFDDTLSGGHALLRAVILNVPRGGVRDLPEAGEIGLPVRRARNGVLGGVWATAAGAIAHSAATSTSRRHRCARRSSCTLPGAVSRSAGAGRPGDQLAAVGHREGARIGGRRAVLGRYPLTTTSLPIGKSVFRTPRLRSAFGPAVSIAQLTTFPSAPLTSM